MVKAGGDEGGDSFGGENGVATEERDEAEVDEDGAVAVVA